jgi:Tol biopolymer transport system component
VQRQEARESLNSPAWWPDNATLLFERQDVTGQPVGAPGQEVPHYPSRIDRVTADGSGRATLLSEGRQPSAAPDGTRLVFARTTNTGASLLVWSQADGSLTTIVPEGRFADVAYPRFSPHGDLIAFVAPQSGLNGKRRPIEALFGVQIAEAHGIPWDPWVIDPDGGGLRRLAETGADEPSIAWSPDQSQLFVYSGTGSFLLDAASGAVSPLTFVQGYGPVAWVL